MKTVTIDRVRLLVEVTKNHDKHIEEYDDAVEGYIEQYAQGVEDFADGLRDSINAPKFTTLETIQAVRVNRFKLGMKLDELDEPKDHRDDYTRVIAMLKMSADTTIELSDHDFDRYVLDNWEWKNEFTVSNVRYTKKGT